MDSIRAKAGDAPARGAPPREVELKLSVAPTAIEDLLAYPLLAKARAAPNQGGALRATYFDTDDQDLRRAGFALRIRRHGGRFIQTLKAERDAPGLVLDRHEWETPLDGQALDWSALEQTALAPLIRDKGLEQRLKPLFSVHTDRRAFLIDRKRARIELVLDRVEIAAGEQTARFGEIELEVKRGTGIGLFDLALELAAAAPVRLSLATKSARGYALLDSEPPAAVKAEPIRLAPGQTGAEAFQAIARSCLAQAVANEALVREHRLAAAVHQFRVGLRRLRAAASLFSGLVSDEESRAIRAELRWMNHSTGEVRDHDVLMARMRDAPGHEPALAAAEARREELYDGLLARLDEPRFRRGLLATAAWIETGRWLTLDDPELAAKRNEPVEERAARELAKRRKRVIKRAERLAALDPETRHQLRIEAKKLRYGVEFFGRLFTGKKAKKRRKRTSHALEELQESLGTLNDIAVGGPLTLATMPGNEAGGDADECLDRAEQA